MKETLSVVLATYNEEKNIEECLRSIQDIASEIIIVDGGSSDETVNIAKKYKCRIVVTDNPKIFHINKQKAIDLARSDWVLQLDADERVDSDLSKEILDKINSSSSLNGFWMPRKNYFLGRYLMKGGQYPDYTLRLYRNGKGYLPQKSVHEQAVVEGKTGYLTNPLIHIADPSFSRYILRFSRYTDLISKELLLENPKFSIISFIKYMFIMPSWWFVMTYFRHKGFLDSWQGFVFSLFSSLRFPISYIKYLIKII